MNIKIIRYSDNIDSSNNCIPVTKRSSLLLLCLLAAGFTATSDGAYGQINREYMQQEREEHRCKFEWWPNAQYELESLPRDFSKQATDNRWPNSLAEQVLLPKEFRILVKDDEVYKISFKEKCNSEFIGYINSDFTYSPTRITHFSIRGEELIEYYKHPLKTLVNKLVYKERSKSDKDNE